MAPTYATAQLPNQSFEVVPEPDRATVGDPIVLRFRVRLDPLDLLYDSVPSPASELREGVRILSVEKLQRGPSRNFTGRARVAFYRPGRQAVPVFALPFMRGVKGMTRGTLTSDSAFVEIDSVAPPGTPALKDIRDIVRPHGRDPRIVAAAAAGAAILLGAAWAAARRRRVPTAPGAEAPAPALPGPSAYERARARLAAIERERWPERGSVDLHYAAIADALRRYFEEAHGLPALGRTTGELVAIIEPAAPDGLGARCLSLLDDADLVKFARARPGPGAAAAFARSARALLDDWHSATPEVPRPPHVES
ncbi:MAG TPA: hypothetical protein VFK09_00550 [Gemmatimonadales bacterium]|nr:hypothetical protein [Gemmatimonadales bacterium]